MSAPTLNRLQKLALDALRAEPHRDIYEGGDSAGKGTCRFYITYGGGVELSLREVQEMLSAGLLTERYPGKNVRCYRLSEK